jgi:hypothetical protein
LISTPNLLSLRNRFNFMAGHIHRVIENPFVSFLKAKRLGNMGHLRLYAGRELCIMLGLLGFHPGLHYEFLDHSEYRPDSLAERSQAALGTRSIENRIGSLARKFIRSPASYYYAAIATALHIAERFVPNFRPSMFVLATKARNAKFDENYRAELEKLISENDLNAIWQERTRG